ncbi:MAG: hypothetical protein Q8O99_02065 [bacterium]|nr:hypothetical protein [bacterium]
MIQRAEQATDQGDYQQASDIYQEAFRRDTNLKERYEATAKEVQLKAIKEVYKTKTELDFNDVDMLVQFLNNYDTPVTIDMPALMPETLTDYSRSTGNETFVNISTTEEEYLATKLKDIHTIRVPHPGVDKKLLDIRTKYYIDCGLFSGNYTKESSRQLLLSQDERLYIIYLIKKVGPHATVFLPPYNHDASGGERNQSGRASNVKDIWRYYAGDGGTYDVTNPLVIGITTANDLNERSYNQIRMIPSKTLEFQDLGDIQDVGDIDYLLTGKGREYRHPTDGNDKQNEKEILLKNKYTGKPGESFTTAQGSRFE